MTTPTTLPPLVAPGSLGQGAGTSVKVVKDSTIGAFSSVLEVVAPLLAGAVVLAVIVAALVTVARIRREVRSGRQQLDPRTLVDPNASDVLGVWS